MNELERHIEILLLKSDCVIVPGLGGFIANHVPAVYDENDNMFIPPRRTLGFNSKLNVNDSLLVQSYTETYDMSFPEALIRIQDEVDELKQHLRDNGSYRLNNIGTLYLNDDENIEFTPCEAGISTPSLYGLSSFEMAKNTKSDVNENAAKHKKKNKKTSSKIVPITSAKTNTESQKKHNNGKTNFMINVAASIIAILMFMFFSTPVNDGTSTIKMGNMDNGVIQNLIDNSYGTAEPKKEVKLNNETVNKTEKTVKAESNDAANADTIKVADAKVTEDSPYFSIVLASRVTKSNAEAFVNTLNKEGLDKAVVLTDKNKKIKVIYGQYKSQKEAYNNLNKLRSNKYFHDAWIYQVKN